MLACNQLQHELQQIMPTKSSMNKAKPIGRTAAKPLTNKAIEAMQLGETLSDGAIEEGAGRLKAVRLGKDTTWRFIYWSGDKRKTINLNGKASKYSSKPADGCLTLAQAREKARVLQAMVGSGQDVQIQRELDRGRVKKEQDTALIAMKQAGEKTLGALLEAYAHSLDIAQKSVSARDVRNIVKNHVAKPFPELNATPAAEITPSDVSRILARLVGPEALKKKGRTAVKLRSFMGSAYKLGIGAHIDPMSPGTAGGFGVTRNPVTDVPVAKMAAAFNKKGKRTLSLSELGFYVGHLSKVSPEVQRLALEIQILSGGQRFEQLLRLKHSEVGGDEFRLLDGKGRRTEPREHWLPMVPELKVRINRLIQMNPVSEANPEGYLFASVRGALVQAETLSGAVLAISDHMVAEGEATEAFRGGDIRRTCETVLAEHLQLPKDIRAQLLSHGIGGVQDAHYDKSKHLQAKRSALIKWHAFLRRKRSEPVNGLVWPRASSRKPVSVGKPQI